MNGFFPFYISPKVNHINTMMGISKASRSLFSHYPHPSTSSGRTVFFPLYISPKVNHVNTMMGISKVSRSLFSHYPHPSTSSGRTGFSSLHLPVRDEPYLSTDLEV
jgi:hypothetical protein